MYKRPKAGKGMTDDKLKISTGKSVDGKWLWDDGSIQMELIITRDGLTIQHGKGMTFKIEKPMQADPHWFGDYLVFLPTLYFARYADEDVLLFGELRNQFDEVIWEKEFNRIKPFK